MATKLYWFTFLIILIFLPKLSYAQFGPRKEPNDFFSWLLSGNGAFLTFLYWVLGTIGLLSVINIAIAVILYVTAAGDDDRTSKAGSFLVYAIFGIAVYIGGYFLLGYFHGFLGP